MSIPSQDLEKRCSLCGETKQVSEFYMRTNGRLQERCKACFKERAYRSRDLNRVTFRRRHADWYLDFKTRVRRAIFEAYGGYRCACCGELERKFLTLDHINNDGAADRIKIAGKRSAAGWTTYRYLYKHGFPPGYQILCMNCNFGKRMNKGVCPHKVRCND